MVTCTITNKVGISSGPSPIVDASITIWNPQLCRVICACHFENILIVLIYALWNRRSLKTVFWENRKHFDKSLMKSCQESWKITHEKRRQISPFQYLCFHSFHIKVEIIGLRKSINSWKVYINNVYKFCQKSYSLNCHKKDIKFR